MKSCLVILALVAVSSSTFGLIGEEANQIDLRYGSAKQVIAEHGKYREVGYDYRGFLVVVLLVDGISKQEGFARPGRPMLSADAIKQILEISAPASLTWRELSSRNGDRIWELPGGKAKAILPAQGNFLMVQDPKWRPPE